MSDQTPPDQGPDSEPTPESGAEPTPSTPEGAPAGPAPMAEGAPQDPETTETSEPTAAAPTPAGKSGRGKILAIIAAVVVVVLVAGGLVGYLLLKSDAHKVVTPATAGSMKRDTAKEKALATQLDTAKQQFITQGQPKCSKKTDYVKSAVYDQKSAKRGPAGSLVFLGAKLTKVQVPTAWRTNCFTKAAKANGLTVINVSSGDGDGKAACASVTSPQKIAICAWATPDTIGYLVPTVAGYDSKTLAKIMRSLRSDVEQSE